MKIRPHQWIFITLFLAVTIGCSEGEKIAPNEQTSEATEEDFWATQRQPMDKAKALEQQLQQQADQRREEMEKQGY